MSKNEIKGWVVLEATKIDFAAASSHRSIKSQNKHYPDRKVDPSEHSELNMHLWCTLPLRKLQYTDARTNVTHWRTQPKYSNARNLSIVAHALASLRNVGACGPSVPQPPRLTSPGKLLFTVMLYMHSFDTHTFERVGGPKILFWDRPIAPKKLL